MSRRIEQGFGRDGQTLRIVALLVEAGASMNPPRSGRKVEYKLSHRPRKVVSRRQGDMPLGPFAVECPKQFAAAYVAYTSCAIGNGHDRRHAELITCSHAEIIESRRTMLDCRILSDSP